MDFLKHFPNQVINLHPALPGMFAGLHAIERTYAAIQAGEAVEAGVMVHFVPDEEVDAGPVIESKALKHIEAEDLEDFELRMHQLEHYLIVNSLVKLSNE